MDWLKRSLHDIQKGVDFLAFLLLAIMVVNVTLAVIARYVLQNSLSWSEEFGRYMMVWCGFLGCSIAIRDDSHVGVSMVVDLCPPALRKFMIVLNKVVVAVFIIVVFVTSLKHLNTLSIQKSSALEIPMILPYLSVTIGMALMFLENLRRIADVIKKPIEAPKKGA